MKSGSHPRSKEIVLCLITLILCTVGCGGTYEFRVQKFPEIPLNQIFPESVSLKVSSEDIYNYNLGFSDYKLYVREGIEKHYEYMLAKCFNEVLKDKTADVNLQISTLGVSILPLKGVMMDIRLSFKVEIFNKELRKEKTVVIDGFGSDPDGNRALEQAIGLSFRQLLPTLEDMYVKY